jgi:hypothetical protein
MNEQDIRTLGCPRCKKTGVLRLDPVTASIKCRTCGTVPQTDLEKQRQRSQTPKTRKKHLPPPNTYPPIPKDATHLEKIEEYYMDRHEGTVDRVHVGTIYCPRDPVQPDPIFKAADGSHELLAGQFEQYLNSSPHAQFVLFQYDKKIKNRRRYRRDLARREEQ